LIDVRIIEDFIADAVSKIPVTVVNAAGRPLTNQNRLSQIIDKTNPSQSWRDIIKELSIFYGITGNAFLLFNEDYLYTLSPANMRIDLAKPVELPEYMNRVLSYTLELSGMEYYIGFNQVYHIKTAQLFAENGIWTWGSSPYSAAIPVIEQLEALYSSRVSMIKDRGALGVLSNKSQIFSEEAMKEVKKKLKDYGTLSDQEKYIVTTEDLSWQQMSLDSKQLEYINQGKDAFAKLCELRGIDPLIFNAEGSTYANQEQGIKETYRRAIIPIAQQIYDGLKDFLKYHYSGHYLTPDFSAVEELQDTGSEFSTKVISELSAGILTPEQAFNMLYDETDMKFEADKEKEKNRQMMLDAVMQNRENGQEEKEEEDEIEKRLIWTTS
jgi:HK97 family phage portal protein